ncbi:hypothetical protein M2308_003411 [Rhizobium leguminosarum]|nr:hypothetical protein [Rhizobium leguminosarum]
MQANIRDLARRHQAHDLSTAAADRGSQTPSLSVLKFADARADRRLQPRRRPLCLRACHEMFQGEIAPLRDTQRNMRDYLKSKDFHRHMRSLLASGFQELGWESQLGGKCSFARGGRVCWLQVSQYSNSVLGAKFTINMTESSGPAGDTRILYRLDKADRAIGKALEEHIIAHLPRPDPDPEIEVVGDNGQPVLVRLGDLVRANPRQWEAATDVWLPYFSKSDLDDWAAFLLPRLERLTAPSSSEKIDPQWWAQRFRRLTRLFRSK